MHETPDRRTLTVIAIIVILGVALATAVLSGGGQTSKILSTVGAPVTEGGGTGSGSGSAGAVDPTPAPDTGGALADAGPTVPSLLIVRTGTLALTVADLDRAVRDADAAVGRAGGYVSGSDRTAGSGADVASVSYRIPSAAWQSTLEAIRAVATRVDVDQVKTDEVTGQVVDLTARIANLRATEAALQAIMGRAARISDVLAVQDQLTTTRGEIEKLVGEKTALVDRASYGSLDVTFRLPVTATPRPTPAPTRAWDPGEDAARATAKLVTVGQASTTVGIWLAIVGLPIVMAAAIAVAIAWQLYRVGRWLVRRRLGVAGEA